MESGRTEAEEQEELRRQIHNFENDPSVINPHLLIGNRYSYSSADTMLTSFPSADTMLTSSSADTLLTSWQYGDVPKSAIKCPSPNLSIVFTGNTQHLPHDGGWVGGPTNRDNLLALLGALIVSPFRDQSSPVQSIHI